MYNLESKKFQFITFISISQKYKKSFDLNAIYTEIKRWVRNTKRIISLEKLKTNVKED